MQKFALTWSIKLPTGWKDQVQGDQTLKEFVWVGRGREDQLQQD